ncbi:MAG: hypothetical protein ACREQA_13665 [Candidatus Binatia bacterium]
MSQEVKLGSLVVSDQSGKSSELLLTNLRVYQRQESKIFGRQETIIPHQAITTVRIGWQRLWWVLALGIIGVGVYIATYIYDVDAAIQYSSLVVGIGMLLLFWFYKPSEFLIMAPTASVGGTPRNHDDVRKFCDLLLSVMEGYAEGSKMEEQTAANKKEASETEWRL